MTTAFVHCLDPLARLEEDAGVKDGGAPTQSLCPEQARGSRLDQERWFASLAKPPDSAKPRAEEDPQRSEPSGIERLPRRASARRANARRQGMPWSVAGP